MTPLALLDKWREALARAESDEDQDAEPGELLRRGSFEEVQREFLAWFEPLERLARAVRDPFAENAAEAMASYSYDDEHHCSIGDVLLDIVDTGVAMQVRDDAARLLAIRLAARRCVGA